MKRLLKRHEDGTEIWFHSDGEKFHIEHSFDASPVVDYAKKMASSWTPRKGEIYRHVGSVPLWLIQKWRNKYGVDALHPDNWDFLKKKLNDIDYRDLRVWQGQL